jgi:hypothetical protein
MIFGKPVKTKRRELEGIAKAKVSKRQKSKCAAGASIVFFKSRDTVSALYK